MKNAKRLMFLLMLLAASVGIAAAMGTSEAQKSYNSDLEREFPVLARAVYVKEITAADAQSQLRTLRNHYGIPYTDEAGIIDSLLDKSGDGDMSSEEAEFYFGLLSEGKLMAYRRESQKRQAEIHYQEVVSLLDKELGEQPDAESLLNSLNNYYDFFGLSYGDDYHGLSRLIFSFRDGEMTLDGLKKEISSISARLALEEAARLRENSSDSRRDSSTAQAGGSSSVQSGTTQSTPGSSSSTGSSGNKPSSGSPSSSAASATKR